MDYIQKVRNRLHVQNKNWLCVICGETGSGKSYSAISIANSIAGDTNKVYVIFTPLEFFTLLDSGNLKKGDVIVADEFGVSMSAREWQSVQNKMMGLILQVFRHMNLAVIFTVPHLNFIDVQARKLMHCYMETAHIDYQLRLASLSVYEIQVSSKYDKIYYKHPLSEDEHGRITKVQHIAVIKPTKDELLEYEQRKEEFSRNLRRSAVESLQKSVEPNNEIKAPVKKDLKAIAESIKDNPVYHKLFNNKKRVNVDLLKNDYGLTFREANMVRDIIYSNPSHT